ncbi:MAG: hypothetical protein AAF892_07415 [Cyanobacteria bacterium P01_D01_bin.71]
MKLTYRGVPYKALLTNKSLAAAQPHHQADDEPTFQKVRLRYPSNELTYRGVRYTR